MTNRIPEWPMTYFHSQCCTDQFSFYSRAYFYLFISRAWWVHVPLLPPSPRALSCPRGIQQRGGGGGGRATTPLLLSVEIPYFRRGICSVLDTGCRGGSVCVCVRFLGDPCCRRGSVGVSVCACPCAWVASGFTAGCTRSLSPACPGVSPARRGRLSLHTPPRGPRLWIGLTPSGF